MGDFEEQARAVVEEYGNQEVPRLLDQLAEMGIGRPLYVETKTSALSKEAQVKTGIETAEETILVKVGHALPADEEETSHIIIAPDGSMMFITAFPTSEKRVIQYKNLIL